MPSFRCHRCGETHDGIPSFGWDYPVHYLAIPEKDRSRRCLLTPDSCVIDTHAFYVSGSLEVPVLGYEESLSWRVWVSLSRPEFDRFSRLHGARDGSRSASFSGWLAAHIWIYDDTLNLKATVHLRDRGLRPRVELEPTAHPLAVEQRRGITLDRVAEIYAQMTHPPEPAT